MNSFGLWEFFPRQKTRRSFRFAKSLIELNLFGSKRLIIQRSPYFFPLFFLRALWINNHFFVCVHFALVKFIGTSNRAKTGIWSAFIASYFQYSILVHSCIVFHWYQKWNDFRKFSLFSADFKYQRQARTMTQRKCERLTELIKNAIFISRNYWRKKIVIERTTISLEQCIAVVVLHFKSPAMPYRKQVTYYQANVAAIVMNHYSSTVGPVALLTTLFSLQEMFLSIFRQQIAMSLQ